MVSSSNFILITFAILFVLLMINGLSYLQDRRTEKAKTSDGTNLFQWPMPLLYSGLILLAMAGTMSDSMPFPNMVLLGFAGLGCLMFGFVRLTNPYGLFRKDKKKKNEEL